MDRWMFNTELFAQLLKEKVLACSNTIHRFLHQDKIKNSMVKGETSKRKYLLSSLEVPTSTICMHPLTL